jgi:hypothetical protein
MYVHGGIRIHALRELNLTRNLEYVLWGARICHACADKLCLSLLLERAAILQGLAFLMSPDQLPRGVYKALSCVSFRHVGGKKQF